MMTFLAVVGAITCIASVLLLAVGVYYSYRRPKQQDWEVVRKSQSE